MGRHMFAKSKIGGRREHAGNGPCHRAMLVLLLAVSYFPLGTATAEPARIVFDTDFGNDIDDVLALGVLHSLQTRGESVLLATTSSKDHPKSVLFLDAVNTFYGRPDIPIGAVSSGMTPDEGRFLLLVDRKDAAGLHYPRDIQQADDAVSLLRATLAREEDHAVVLIQVGFFTNLRRLLESTPDEHSDLGGVELVRKKVQLLSVMAGSFQTIADENHYIEWNVLMDIPSAQFLARDWPTPVVWSGAEIGLSVPYPSQSIEKDYNYTQHHPLKEGYYLYKPPPHDRPTWDLTSVLYAVRPDHGYFDLSVTGQVTVEDDGFTRFDAVDGGRDRFLKVDAEKVIRVREALVQLSSEPPDTHQADMDISSSKSFERHVVALGGRVDYVFGDERTFEQCHAPTVVQAADSSLISAWFGGTEEKDPDVGVWMSSFDGKVWSEPFRTAKVNNTSHWNPVLFRDSSDVIHNFFKVGVDEIHWATYWSQSSDNGAIWSQAVELVKGDIGGRGPVKNKPIILSDGSWLAPASIEYMEGQQEVWKAFSDRSDDAGKTWQRSADFVVPESADGQLDFRFRGKGAIQPTFWESKPGHVHALLRTGSGEIWRADSDDSGLTWSPYSATGLPSNNSGFDALRLNDGRVILIYNPVGETGGARTPLDITVSADNGHSWKTIAHLEDDRDVKNEYSYPSIVETKDGIAACYTWRRERIRCWQIPLSAIVSH